MTKAFANTVLLSIAMQISAYAADDQLPDSVKSKKSAPASHWRLTARLHSQGIFTFGGRLGSPNPTWDVNFVYDRKKWGLLYFKGADFVDHTTFYNYSLLTVYKNLDISKRLRITPSVGTFLEQANSVADRGSDLVIILTSTFKINKKFSLEQMSLFGNLVIEPTERDWVNRLRLIYTGKHLDVIPAFWHNNNVFDQSSYWSTGLNVAYSRVKVADHFFLSMGLTGVVMLKTTDEINYPKKNALMFTLAMQWLH